jgi:hypothetical protein
MRATLLTGSFAAVVAICLAASLPASSGDIGERMSAEEASQVVGGLPCKWVLPTGQCGVANRAKGSTTEHCSTATGWVLKADSEDGDTQSVTNGNCQTPCFVSCGGITWTNYINCAGESVNP